VLTMHNLMTTAIVWVDGVIKDIQDYGKNKDEHSLTTTIYISYIIGDMLGEKKV